MNRRQADPEAPIPLVASAHPIAGGEKVAQPEFLASFGLLPKQHRRFRDRAADDPIPVMAAGDHDDGFQHPFFVKDPDG
jgi:hypothetical protein